MLRLVINLKRSSDRWRVVSQELEKFHLPFERIEAVDGQALEKSMLNSLVPPLDDISKICCPRALSSSEIACFLSHKKCWQKLVDSNENWALIMEDDIKVSDRALKFIENPDWIPDGVHILQLHIWRTPWKAKVSKKYFPLDEDGDLYIPLHPAALGAQAYLISKKAAQEAIKMSPKISAPVDEFLSGIFSSFAQQFPTYRLNPAVVTIDDTPSTIDVKGKIKKLPFSKKIKNHPLRLFLKIKNQILYTLFARTVLFIYK